MKKGEKKIKVRNIVTGEIRNATWRTNHAASSYGLPVLTLDNGEAVDAIWWQKVEPAKPENRRTSHRHPPTEKK